MAEAAIDTGRSGQVCSRCNAPCVDLHFCAECGCIQAVVSGTDYFSFLGLPRKLRLNEAELEKTFYALSRQFHPDYFMSAGPAEQQASIERSSMLNDAYRTLRDHVRRVQYLLLLEGYKEAEKRPPADLLEEVFELNMQIEELKMAKKTADEDEIAAVCSSLENALSGLRARLEEIDRRLLVLFENWDAVLQSADASTDKKPVLDRMSELLSHRSYVSNLVRDIREEL